MRRNPTVDCGVATGKTEATLKQQFWNALSITNMFCTEDLCNSSQRSKIFQRNEESLMPTTRSLYHYFIDKWHFCELFRCRHPKTQVTKKQNFKQTRVETISHIRSSDEVRLFRVLRSTSWSSCLWNRAQALLAQLTVHQTNKLQPADRTW